MLAFVCGDWCKIPTGALCRTRYFTHQTTRLPDNWAKISDEAKWAWTLANQATEVPEIRVYFEGRHLGNLKGEEYVFDEILEYLRSNDLVLCEVIAPCTYDPDLGGKGHFVKIYTGAFAVELNKKRRHEELLGSLGNWSFFIASAALAVAGWLWLHP